MNRTIEDVLRDHERGLLARLNVIGVGIGERDGRPVIVVFVLEKMPRFALRPRDVIPPLIEGYPVDVRQRSAIGSAVESGDTF